METITDTLGKQHSRCDNVFAQAEEDVAKMQWNDAQANFTRFVDMMEQHFTSEEQILFPSFEKRTGQTAGPTQVMRMEHQQMRGIFAQMQSCVANRDNEEYLGLSETLLMLMRQHNLKEEQMLYPMCDQALAGEAADILEGMRAQGGA